MFPRNKAGGGMWVWLVLLGACGLARGGGPSYCSTNVISSASAGMQLTKEPVPNEYGYEDQFKSIHCCGKGYRSIECHEGGGAWSHRRVEGAIALEYFSRK
ncbi:unnamed protein product [Plutella xylostella]|uniref:(diamondback moth) hypothetical protein n=1 Tax=Plutella xylostella TaxID=51655 RepID=A0A8S4DZM0_PLUXY|nr:unnamed protein product [Plutella xylostella]